MVTRQMTFCRVGLTKLLTPPPPAILRGIMQQPDSAGFRDQLLAGRAELVLGGGHRNSVLRSLARSGFVLAISSCLLGCPTVTATPKVGRTYPAPGGTPHTIQERREAELRVEPHLSGNILTVSVEKDFECRTVTSRPALQEVTDVREMSDSGKKGMMWLGIGSAAVAGLGVALLAAPCNAQDEQGQDRPCTADEANGQKNAGATLTAVGAAMAVPIVINAFRSIDTARTATTQDMVRASEWARCEAELQEGVEVSLLVASREVVSAKTDDGGEVRFDLASDVNLEEIPSTIAPIRLQAAHGSTVKGEDLDLSKAPIFPAWRTRADLRAKQDREEAAQKARQAQEDAQRLRAEQQRIEQARIAAREKELSAWPAITASDALRWVDDHFVVMANVPGFEMDSLRLMPLLLACGGLALVNPSEAEARCALSLFVVLIDGEENLIQTKDGRYRIPPDKNQQRLHERSLVQKNGAAWARRAHQSCMQNCLTSHVAATRDHCEATCR